MCRVERKISLLGLEGNNRDLPSIYRRRSMRADDDDDGREGRRILGSRALEAGRVFYDSRAVFPP